MLNRPIAIITSLSAFSLPKTLLTIQALRGVAAGAVVAYHTLVMLRHNAGYDITLSSAGASGVDLFFVISGFIMIYTNYHGFGQPGTVRRFLRRRAIRIVPMYWLCTTGIVVLLAVAPQLFSNTRWDWQNIVSSYLFLLSENNTGQLGTVLQTGWTLCYEAYFYLVFALLLILPRKYFLVLLGAVFMLGIGIDLSTRLPPWASVISNPLLLEFYLGTALAFSFIKRRFLPGYAGIGAIVFAIGVILLNADEPVQGWHRVIYWGLPTGLLLYGAISLEVKALPVPRPLVALGDSSYSLYLIHPYLLPAFGKLWLFMGLTKALPPAGLFVIAFSFALAAGHLVYLTIEKPLFNWLSKRFR